MPALRTDFHCSLIPLSRSNGFDAVHGAAYRSGERLENARGEVFDYSRRALKREIGASFLVAPKAISWPLRAGRQAVWQAADAAETRKNSVPAYDLELAIPHELSRKKIVEMLRQLAQEIAEAHCVVVDVGFHLPHEQPPTAPEAAAPGESDESWKNVHAHLLASARALTHDGYGAKVREFSDNRDLGPATILHWRGRWAQVVNAALREAGIDSRVTHLSYETLGLDLEPMQHEGRRARYGKARAVDADIAAKNAEIRQRNRAKLAAVVVDENGERVLDEPTESLGELQRQQAEVAAQIAQLEEDERVAQQIEGRRKRQRAAKPLAPAPRPRPAVASVTPTDESQRDTWRRLREERLLRRYADTSEVLAHYWRDRREADGSVVYENKTGKVVDEGPRITAANGNDREIQAMLELARLKQWRAIQFSGDDDFKARAMTAAIVAGLRVTTTTDHDASILAKARAALLPKPAAVVSPLAAMKAALDRVAPRSAALPPTGDAKPPSPPASANPKPGRRRPH